MSLPVRLSLCLILATVCSVTIGLAAEDGGAEAAVRALVQANADKDMAGLSRLMAHDADIVSYTLGGRKYIGWPDLEHDMQKEFATTATLELPITQLKVWTRGDLAWFAMELDYIRTVGQGQNAQRAVLPLRETGVLERRNGQWLLHSWHESFRNSSGAIPIADKPKPAGGPISAASNGASAVPDLSGEWDILEVEDNKTYKATLDKAGNGPYTQQGGRFATTKFDDRLWQGTWHQTGNDREGGFEVLLSEDGTQAKGVWWYSRVGDKINIPPRQWGGTYVWKRVPDAATAK